MLHIAAVPAVHFLVSLVCQCPERPSCSTETAHRSHRRARPQWPLQQNRLSGCI